jgi:hypothetical protein
MTTLRVLVTCATIPVLGYGGRAASASNLAL